jgi:hypothetical protein
MGTQRYPCLTFYITIFSIGEGTGVREADDVATTLIEKSTAGQERKPAQPRRRLNERRDVNGYPPPVYPRVKTLLGCGYGGIFPRRVT